MQSEEQLTYHVPSTEYMRTEYVSTLPRAILTTVP